MTLTLVSLVAVARFGRANRLVFGLLDRVGDRDVSVLRFGHCDVHVVGFGLVFGLRDVVRLVLRHADVMLFYFGFRDVVGFLNRLVDLFGDCDVVWNLWVMKQ